MKKHLSKKLLSLFLAVVLLVTSAPLVAFAYTLAEPDENTKYLFAYFTSNTQYGQQIRFAVSEDGLNYEPLNYNRPIIEHSDDVFEEGNVAANTQYASSSDTSAGYARDPYIFKGQDNNYYMVATDMDASVEWSGDSCLVFWRSADLINWYQISVFDVRTKSGFENTIRAWAPQVIWDSDQGQYMVYWANYLSDWSEALYYCYTSDFISFSDPQVLYDVDYDAIDADIVKYNDTYYMFYKDESAGTVGYVTSSNLTGPYSNFINCTRTDQAVEGNFMYQLGNSGQYVLMLDEYVNGSFVFQITSDFLGYEMMDTADYSFNGFSPRHGSVVQISNEEYETLLAAYSNSTEIGSIEYPFSNEATYDSSTGDWYQGNNTDASGHTFDVAIGAWVNGSHQTYSMSTSFGATDTASATTGDGYTAYMSNIFINDPDVREFLRSENFTVSFDYTPYMDTLTNNNNNILADWTNGTSNSSGNSGSTVIFSVSTEQYDFIRIRQNGALEVYTGSGYTSIPFDTPLEGTTAHYTLTYDGTATILYIDNVEAARVEGDIPGIEYGADKSGGYTSSDNGTFYASLGWTDVCATAYKPFGKYENLVFYDRAFTATEAQLGSALDLDSLEGCISSFESLLKSGNMYLNTPDAYEYYTEAQRLITVRDYGTIDVTEKLNDCYDHFKAAIEKMSVWSGKYKTKDLYTAYFDVENIGSSIIAETGKTYDESTQDNNAWQLSNGSYEASYQIDSSWVGSNTTTHLSVYGDSYIMLYDGVNDITAPLKFRYYSNTGTFCDNNGLLSIYINNDDLGYSTQSSNRILLTGVTDNDIDFAHYHWNEVRGDTDGNYQQNVANYEIGNDRYYTTGSGGQDESGQVGFQSDTGTIHYYGNSYVTYTGTPTSTLTQINPNVIFVDAYGNHTSFGNSGVLCSRGTNYSNYSLDGSASLADGNASTYYIIDVSSISKNLQTGAENLMNADLSSFSYDMMDVFNASQSAMEYEPYDEITGRDDNGYISKDSMQSQAQSIADEIDTISDSLNSDAIYIDVDGYSALKTIRNNNQINQMYATGNSAGYTTDTWNTFKDAYEAAVEQINTLADNAFVNEFDTNGNENTTVKDVVENLYKAYYGLRQCADFTEIREVSSEDDIQSGLSTGLGTPESQNYAYGLWYDFESAYNAVQDFNAQYGEGSESNEPKYASSEQEISTEGFTFTVEVENTDKYSEIQQKSFDLSQALRDAAEALAAPAPDYTAYNAATDLLKYQDVAAFAAGSSASVYETIREQGTKDASVTYNNGVGTSGSAVIATPAYNGVATAYVTDESGTVWKNQSSQDALDKQTASILTDINTVNTENDESRSTFDVTFTYQIGEDGAPVTQQYTYYYGQTFPAVVPDGLTAYKWEVTANGTTMEIPAAQTYNAYITSDVTIVAYCSEEAIENEITVQILNQYGHLVQEYVVADDTQITVDKNTFSIGGNTYTSENTSWLANTPFYTFDGWQVNGHNYNNGSTFTASSVAENGTVTLKMKFTVASDYYEVTMDGGNVANALTGEEGTAFHYDTKVTATPDESAYGIAIEIDGQYYAVSYGTEPYSFYTVGEAHLYSIYKDGSNYIIDNKVVSDSNVIRKLDMRLPFSYTISQWVEPKFTPYSATTANIPDDANVVITEVGTIYTQNATDNFVIGEAGVTAIAAKNQLDTEQYFIRFNLKEGQTVYARSYVKYSFVNSDGTTVQTVDYGNIVQCTY